MLRRCRRRFRQRLVHLCQWRHNGGRSDQWLWLDDPVIDGIKRHLNVRGRIGSEPISQKFARIAFHSKQRMTMNVTDLHVVDGRLPTYYIQVCVVKKRLGAVVISNECWFGVPLSEVKVALQLLFRHIRKWQTIRYLCMRNTTTFSKAFWDGHISHHLLDAILAVSRETVDVGQLLFVPCTANELKIAEFVRRSAPNLRYLSVPVLNVGETAQQQSTIPPLLEMAQAIRACQNLRSVWLASARSQQFPLEFIGNVLALPQLTNLGLGHSPPTHLIQPDGTEHELVRRHFPGLHSLSIDEDWLQAISRLPQLPLLKAVQHFQLMTKSQEDVLLGLVWRIVAEMRSPAFVDLHYLFSAITWEDVFNNYLPMVYRTGADVVRTLCYGLPTLTDKEFQEGLATLPPLIQLALTPPDLATALAMDDRYQTLSFTFASGAKITFKAILP